MSSPPERTCEPPPPPAAAPSARPPSMRKLVATISKLVRFWPSLSCHSRDWMRPSMKISEPFLRYCWAISACLPDDDLVPLGALLALAVFVFVGLVGGQGKICEGLAAAGVARFVIAAQAADEDHL